MLSDEQWERFKSTIPGVEELSERILAERRREAEALVAGGESIDDYLTKHDSNEKELLNVSHIAASQSEDGKPRTVGDLIAELQKHPADMPVFGWAESEKPELTQEEVPTPNFHLDVEEVALVDAIWVLAEEWEDNLGSDDARAMFENEPVKALLISWRG